MSRLRPSSAPRPSDGRRVGASGALRKTSETPRGLPGNQACLLCPATGARAHRLDAPPLGGEVMMKDTKRQGRRFATAAAVATCGTAIALGPAAGGAAAADCGADAMARPLIDHVNSAHLETSPGPQVRDLMNVDAYVLAHTVLAESVLAPLLPTVAGA